MFRGILCHFFGTFHCLVGGFSRFLGSVVHGFPCGFHGALDGFGRFFGRVIKSLSSFFGRTLCFPSP